MNLFSIKPARRNFYPGKTIASLATLSLLALALTIPAEAGKTKVPKKKKNQDLSANPLANVASRQPDKELFDKAMIALKKGRFDVARLDSADPAEHLPQIRNTRCAPSWPSAMPGSKRAAPRP